MDSYFIVFGVQIGGKITKIEVNNLIDFINTIATKEAVKTENDDLDLAANYYSSLPIN
jgi:hypothetical protein